MLQEKSWCSVHKTVPVMPASAWVLLLQRRGSATCHCHSLSCASMSFALKIVQSCMRDAGFTKHDLTDFWKHRKYISLWALTVWRILVFLAQTCIQLTEQVVRACCGESWGFLYLWSSKRKVKMEWQVKLARMWPSQTISHVILFKPNRSPSHWNSVWRSLSVVFFFICILTWHWEVNGVSQ